MLHSSISLTEKTRDDRLMVTKYAGISVVSGRLAKNNKFLGGHGLEVFLWEREGVWGRNRLLRLRAADPDNSSPRRSPRKPPPLDQGSQQYAQILRRGANANCLTVTSFYLLNKECGFP